MGDEMTKNAKAILDIIDNSDIHPTAEQIYLELCQSSSKMALATVYNNLSILKEQRLIRKISVEGYPDRYDKIKKHDHLICQKCGKLSDIVLEDLTAQLQSQMDEKLLSYDLKISYICPECQKKDNQ